MSAIALRFERFLGERVMDKTGLEDLYDYRIEFTPLGEQEHYFAGTVGDVNAAALPDGLAAAVREPGPTLIVAAANQLGLRLQPVKSPIEMFVIDKVNKIPADN